MCYFNNYSSLSEPTFGSSNCCGIRTGLFEVDDFGSATHLGSQMIAMKGRTKAPVATSLISGLALSPPKDDGKEPRQNRRFNTFVAQIR